MLHLLTFDACFLCLVALLMNEGLLNSFKGKGSPYSIAERMLPELTRFLAVSLHVT